MNRNKSARLGILAAFTATSSIALAYPGDLDKSLNGSGAATIDYGGTESPTAIAVAPDRKIAVAGTTDVQGTTYITVTRFLSNGKLDNSFSDDGGLILDNLAGENHIPKDIAIQPDGKIIITGTTEIDGTRDIFLTRLNANGSRDTFFGKNGVIIENINGNDDVASVKVLPDGKIVVGGTEAVDSPTANNFIALKFLANGRRDTSFGTSGKAVVSFSNTGDVCYAMTIQPDGKVLLAGEVKRTSEGSKTGVARLSSNGTLDYTFSSDGIHTLNTAYHFNRANGITSNGKKIAILSTSTMSYGTSVLRATSAFVIDMSGNKIPGGHGGINVHYLPASNGIHIQKDGSIVYTTFPYRFENNNSFVINRYDPAGRQNMERAVRPTLHSQHRVFASTLQSDDRLLLAGQSGADFSIARLHMISKVDLRIGKNTSANKGNNIYNTTGAGQTISSTVKADGGKATYYLRIQNDGHSVSRFNISFPYYQGRFQTKVFDKNGKNITLAVRGNRFITPELQPGETELLKIEARPTSKKKGLSRKIFITSSDHVSSYDTVLFNIKTK